MTQLASMGGDTAADYDASTAGGPTTAPTPYELGSPPGVLDPEEVRLVDAWWRAANYLSVGQIYLMANPLLREPLQAEHVKPRLLGHFGTVPGLNLAYVHANRLIKSRDLDAVFIAGPGHGGPGPNACAWLEGTYSELYSHVTQDARGMAAFFHQFSFPCGVPSHCAPETPGSFHEGGELGYSLLHAYGAALDSPDLTVFCVVGDGEAETGPLAGSWHAAKFIDPARDGAVLPILALNGFKIANPTILARIPESELLELMRGYGYDPHVVSSDDPGTVHQAFAETLETCLDKIAAIQQQARSAPSELGPDSTRRGLAHDHHAYAEGLDLPPGGRRPARRGDVPRAPGPAAQRPHRRHAPHRARAVAEGVPARGAVRRGRAPRRGAARPAADRPAPDERQPGRQRRQPAA